MSVQREPLYIGAADSPLFASFHTSGAAPARDCVAVICNPLGYEYIHSHRTLRHLADDLARAGVPALRFDYHGTGDSPGTDLDADRLARWQQDIQTAIAAARALSGCTRVCLIGLRMGATLAALTASHTAIDALVLWNPCVAGRRYVREMQALAGGVTSEAGSLESAGFLMSNQTQEDLQALKLLGLPAQVSQGALIAMRDDMAEAPQLAEHLLRVGVPTDVITFSGYVEMMAEPQHTVVPQAALDEITRWVVTLPVRAESFPSSAGGGLTDVPSPAGGGATDVPSPAGGGLGWGPAAEKPPPTSPLSSLPRAGEGAHCEPARQKRSTSCEAAFPFAPRDGRAVQLTETVHRFGEGGHLLGIHCAAQGVPQKRPMVVLFNSGVVHRVGPNRLYTELARELAALGYASFRCDIEGIGDSVLRTPGRENHPYPETAERDALATLHFLQAQLAAQEFVLMGLCSGAYTSFITGLSAGRMPITELVLINPLTYEWHEGDVLDTQHFREVAHYKGAMGRSESWKKLLRGQVNLVHLGAVLLGFAKKQLASYLSAMGERFFMAAAPRLSRQLRQLFERGVRVALVIAEGDPGWDMLNSKARYTAHQAQKRGDLSVHFVGNADHTFSSSGSRMRLLAALRAHFADSPGERRHGLS